MENFNPNNVNCPLCKKIKLRTIKDSKTNVVAYECIDGCGSTFIPDYKVNTEDEEVIFIAKRLNPEDRAYIMDSYEIGRKKF